MFEYVRLAGKEDVKAYHARRSEHPENAKAHVQQRNRHLDKADNEAGNRSRRGGQQSDRQHG
jgi:hypothetical protein